MLLCVDIGNTNIVLGVFAPNSSDGQPPLATWRIASSLGPQPDEYAVLLHDLLRLVHIDPTDITGIAISSSVPPLTTAFRDLCRNHLDRDPLVIDGTTHTGVTIRYDSPRDVGADRVVNAVAVFAELGGPACVVDFGTGTTFDAINAAGDYLGGAIAPGIEIAADALFSRAAQLPRTELVAPPAVVGTNTVHSIQSGLIFGYVGLVEGMVARFRSALGEEMRTIATGGLASVIAGQTSCIERVDPWVTLKGIRLVWNRNQ